MVDGIKVRCLLENCFVGRLLKQPSELNRGPG